MRRYAFRRRWHRALAFVFDALGGLIWRFVPGAPRPEALRRVLVLRLDHLGDGLFAGAALRALRSALPDAEIVLLGGPWAEELYAGTGPADVIRGVEVPWFARPKRGGGLAAWIRLARWVRAQRFDAALDLRGDVRHLVWFACASIPVRLGYGRTGGGFLITHPTPYRDVHEVERNLDLVRALVGEVEAGPLVPVPFAESDSAAAAATAAGPYVVFHVGAGYDSKRWEPEAMARAIDLVEASGAGRAVLVGTRADHAAVEAVLRHVRTPPLVLVGRTTLRQLAALVAGARAFVGHDSGPSHLAVAMGVPAVLVYSGVNDPRLWGPWQGRVALLHSPVECSPCGLARCNRAHECMTGLDPTQVVRALVELVGAREPA